ncbi:pH-response regulator protein palF/RIM8 [Spathaspora sp. JA1]|nr:pH-response regulator protein palF/RIM8 [Spathaspora sp. JA1]
MRRAVSRILPRQYVESTPTLLSSTSLSSSNHKIDFHTIDDFYIQLDSPHQEWLPGQEVVGQVVLITKKNLANIVITLSLVGFIKINASSQSKLRPIKHTLFDHTIKIYGQEEVTPTTASTPINEDFTNGLSKGEHVFPFVVKLPNKRIFTSLDFEKGSINYTLKASIGSSNGYLPGQSPLDESGNHKRSPFLHNPSYTSEKSIKLVNPIDVALLTKRKPKRLILRDPKFDQIKKLSRTQSSTSTINTFATVSSTNSDQSSINSSEPSPDNKNYTHLSSSNHSNITNNNKPQTIKVILEVAQRGYLRGELIPIKISVSHLKNIQDLNGIILTFVRVCRLDNGNDGIIESFRKDLQQSILPLYLDPVTFKAEITTNIRVPADAFPTIVGCPLVSFQYFIEVLINLSGKSAVMEDSDRHTSSDPGATAATAAAAAAVAVAASTSSLNNPAISNGGVGGSIDGNNSYKFNFNFHNSHGLLQHQKERLNFVNTDKFKRSKKFVQLTTEVIIGTHRSEQPTPPEEDKILTPSSNNNSLMESSPNTLSPMQHLPPSISPSPQQQQQQSPLPPPQRPFSIPEIIENFNPTQTTPPYIEQYIPSYDEGNAGDSFMNIMATNSELTEKERMRLRETSLLPSAPPDESPLQVDEQDERNNNI